MTLTEDWTLSLRGVEQGRGTDYCLLPGTGGLGLPPLRIADQPRGARAGDVPTLDQYAGRLLSLPLAVSAPPGGNVWTLVQDLKAAWARVAAGEVELQLRLPGFPASDGTFRFYGRPGGVEIDTAALHVRAVPVLAFFRALDPFAYGPDEVVVDAASPATVTNAGDAPSDRATITITGNGGTPQITNVTDDSKAITFAEPVSGTAVLDLRHRTVVDGTNADIYDQLAPAPEWFDLLPGANTVTFTGCASIEVAFQPAWL